MYRPHSVLVQHVNETITDDGQYSGYAPHGCLACDEAEYPDDEVFCPACLAGTESSEHHEKCADTA